MAKFNTKGYDTTKTTNMEDGTSYERHDLRQEIATVVLNSMLKGDLYYQRETDRVEQIFDLIRDASQTPEATEFAAKAMVYVRRIANLRSVSHVMAIGLGESVYGNPCVRRALRQSIQRPDDATEILSLWNLRHTESDGKATMIPNAIRRAFKDVFESNFDAYQLKKYAAPNAKVKLADVIKLAHPKGRYDLFKRLIEGTLDQAETMGTKLSSGESASVAFGDLLRTRKMGYMQAIKNIRTALVDGLDQETLKLWTDFVTNDRAIANSRMLPFRYYDAWHEVKALALDEFDKDLIKRTLETAFTKSAVNTGLVGSDERIAVLLDESGSMAGDSFYRGKVLAASLLLALGDSQVIMYSFATEARRINVSTILKSPFDWIEDFNANGGGTYFSAPLQALIQTGTKADKLIVFTDMQLYDANNHWLNPSNVGNFDRYYGEYRKIAPDVKLLFWNLAGYDGGTPLKLTGNVFEVAGFSDSMLGVVADVWDNPNALIDEIEAIVL